MSKNKELSPEDERFLDGCLTITAAGFLSSAVGFGIGLLCLTFMKAVGLSILCGLGGFALAVLFVYIKERTRRKQDAASSRANSRPE